jgi:hypothetical protein
MEIREAIDLIPSGSQMAKLTVYASPVIGITGGQISPLPTWINSEEGISDR